MANQLYNHAKKNFLRGRIDMTTATIKTRLVRVVSAAASTYTFSQSHEFMSSVNTQIGTADGGSSTTTDQTITSISVSAGSTPGVVDGGDVTHPTVTSTGTGAATGDQFAVIIYCATGDPATDMLIAYIDTGAGFPIIADGGSETIQWAASSPFIFAL
jgi:hypothetical protein